MQGWIKLHRKVAENELYFSERFTRAQAWIDLLLLAAHKPQTLFIRGVEINLKPGELCYSQLSLAKRWKWNRKTVMAFLKLLAKREMLLNRTDNRLSHFTTVLSIQHWFEYQGDGQPGGQRSGQRRGNGADTNKNEENVNNENTFKGGEFIFSNELLKITARQLDEMKTSYPAIKKLYPHFSLCSDLMREKQQKGQLIGSPIAFLHSHLQREQTKLAGHNPKQGIQQTQGPGTRSGKTQSVEQVIDKMVIDGELKGSVTGVPRVSYNHACGNKGLLPNPGEEVKRGVTIDLLKKTFDLVEVQQCGGNYGGK